MHDNCVWGMQGGDRPTQSPKYNEQQKSNEKRGRQHGYKSGIRKILRAGNIMQYEFCARNKIIKFKLIYTYTGCPEKKDTHF